MVACECSHLFMYILATLQLLGTHCAKYSQIQSILFRLFSHKEKMRNSTHIFKKPLSSRILCRICILGEVSSRMQIGRMKICVIDFTSSRVES